MKKRREGKMVWIVATNEVVVGWGCGDPHTPQLFPTSPSPLSGKGLLVRASQERSSCSGFVLIRQGPPVLA